MFVRIFTLQAGQTIIPIPLLSTLLIAFEC
jgi:hypothetical protein